MAHHFAELLDHDLPLHLPTSHDPLVAAAMRATAADLRSATAAGVARAVGCSERTLRRRFSEVTGMTWRGYLLQSRLLRAMALLADDPRFRARLLRFIDALAGLDGDRTGTRVRRLLHEYLDADFPHVPIWLRALIPILTVVSASQAAGFLLVSIAVIKLRRERPDLPRPYRVPGGIVTAGLAALGSAAAVGLAVYEPYRAAGKMPLEWWLVLGWSVLGAFFWAGSRAVRQAVPETERRVLILGDVDRR